MKDIETRRGIIRNILQIVSFEHPDIRHAIEINHPGFKEDKIANADPAVPATMISDLQEQVGVLEVEVRELRETLALYRERYGPLTRDNWVTDEPLRDVDSYSVQGDVAEEPTSPRVYNMRESPFYRYDAEDNGPNDEQIDSLDHHQMNHPNGEGTPPRNNLFDSNGRSGKDSGKENTAITGHNRLLGSIYSNSSAAALPPQPKVSVREESMFGSLTSFNPPTRPQPRVAMREESMFGSQISFTPPPAARPQPQVTVREESMFGGQNSFAPLPTTPPQRQASGRAESMFNGNDALFGNSPLTARPQPQASVKEDSMFGSSSGDANQPIPQTDSWGIPNELPETYRQPRVFDSGAPHQTSQPDQRTLENNVEHEEKEPSQPSNLTRSPPIPIISVTGNLLGDPNSLKAQQGHARAAAIEAETHPVYIAKPPRTRSNGRKVGIFIDTEKKHRTTGATQYFDRGCFNCGGNHEGSACRKACIGVYYERLSTPLGMIL